MTESRKQVRNTGEQLHAGAVADTLNNRCTGEALDLLQPGRALESKLAELRDEVQLYHRRGMRGQARMLSAVLDEIETAYRSDANETGSVAEVASRLGYDPSSVHRLIRNGDVKAIEVNGNRRIRYTDLAGVRAKVRRARVEAAQSTQPGVAPSSVDIKVLD